MIDKTEGIDAYICYLAVQSHFTRKGYDYFKYGGRVNASESSYLKRKDRWFFVKLRRKFKKDIDMRNFLVAQFSTKDKVWIGDLFDREADETYRAWLKKREGITQLFNQDMTKLCDALLFNDLQFNALFECPGGQHPMVLKWLISDEISVETFVILDSIFNLCEYLDNNIVEKMVWPKWKQKIKKYAPFVLFESDKCREILTERINFYEFTQ